MFVCSKGTRRTKVKGVNKSRHVRKVSFGTAIRQAVRKELLKVGRKNVLEKHHECI